MDKGECMYGLISYFHITVQSSNVLMPGGMDIATNLCKKVWILLRG